MEPLLTITKLTSVLATIYSCSSSHYLRSYFQNMFNKLWTFVWTFLASVSYHNLFNFAMNSLFIYSLLVTWSHTDESWEGRNSCLRIYTLWIYSLSTLGSFDENKIFFVLSPQEFWESFSTWCFEHFGDISCSVLVHPGHTDESWEGRNTSLWIYTLWIYSLRTLENTDKNKVFFCSSITTILAKLSTWCFEPSGDISCYLRTNLSHTDASWKR